MIHSSAIIEKGAKIGKNVSIGPFSYIGAGVEIGDDNVIASHVVIEGHTKIGSGNHIFQFASIGAEPQSVAYHGEPTRVEIGNNNVLREYVTINRGTPDDRGLTSIADDNFLMAYVHIAHDCELGSNIVFANCASLAGHVKVEDYVIMGGFSLVHQFCRVGAHCITGIGSVCIQDVPPYTLAAGNKAITHGINVKGLRRRDFGGDDINQLKKAYKIIYRTGLTRKSAIEEIRKLEWSSDHIAQLVTFFDDSKRGVIR
ncbi:MAG: acyl-ACP--UDP-N-acetylglucosamine O-acyltransferase [Arenicella sp.]